MSDRRIVQCFGIRQVPRKAAKPCRKKYLWTARGSSSGNFGRKGTQACPSCGNPPDFRHPLNRYYGGELTWEQAISLMPEYIKMLED